MSPVRMTPASITVRKFKPGTRPGITSKEAQDKKRDSLEEMRTSKWQFKKTRFSETEERRLLAKVIEILVRTTFKHHVYQFEGHFYIQRRGGSIGLRLTGVVATLVMNYWGDEFDKLLRRNNIETYLNKIYVDDQDLMLKALKTGTKWTGDKMEWKEEWQHQDEELNEETDKRTMREVRKMANTILPFIVMEETVASECLERKLPVLDFKIWQEKRKNEEGKNETVICHEYYENPMSSQLMMMMRSAMPHRTKIVSLSQEVIRRQRNTSRNVSEVVRRKNLSQMMCKLKRSGYDTNMRRKILVSGMRGYKRMVKDEEEGRRPINRPKWLGQKERRYKKLGGKSSWYKRGKDTQQD